MTTGLLSSSSSSSLVMAMLLSLLGVVGNGCFRVHAMSDDGADIGMKVVKGAESETAIDRLRVATTRYLKARHAEYVDDITAQRRHWAQRLQQKSEDNATWSREACLTQMALDFLSDNRQKIEKGPDKLGVADVVKFCVAAQWFFDQNGVISGWRDYEAGVERWALWLLEHATIEKQALKSVNKKERNK